MLDLTTERRKLADADRHIADGEQRITTQLALIARLIDRGLDTVEADHILARMEQILEQHRRHRLLILDTIDAIPHFGL